MVLSFVFYMSVFIGISLCARYCVLDLDREKTYDNLEVAKFYQKKEFWIMVVVFVPVIISAIRYGIGVDYFNYELIYEENISRSLRDLTRYRGFTIEIAPILLCRLAEGVFGNYQGYIFLVALFTGVVYFAFLYNNRFDANFSLMMFVYFILLYPPSFNTFRQILAVGIVAYGFKYVFERKFVRYCFITLLAAMFHTSAIVFILVYFIYNTSRKVVWVDCLVLGAFVLVPIFFGEIYSALVKIPVFQRYLLVYGESLHFQVNYIDILVKIPILLLVLLYSKKLVNKNVENKFWMMIYLIEYVAVILGFYLHWANRFVYYGMVAEIVLIARIVNCEENKKISFGIALGLVVYYLLFFWSVYYSNGCDGIFPYKSILF